MRLCFRHPVRLGVSELAACWWNNESAGGVMAQVMQPPRLDAAALINSIVYAFRGGDLSKYLLRLFVTGASSRTAPAIANLRRICEQELEGRYDLEIIDVQEYPELAEDEKILATPTLIKSLPLPLRRVIGDLSDKDKVLLGLQVEPNPDRSAEVKA